MAHYDIYSEELNCDCSYKTHDDFYSDLKIDLGFDDQINDTKTMICGKCKREYEITLELQTEITININQTELIANRFSTYSDKDGIEFDSIQLVDKTYGDTVNLHDGEYLANNFSYYIEDNKIKYVFSILTTEDQLTLEL